MTKWIEMNDSLQFNIYVVVISGKVDLREVYLAK